MGIDFAAWESPSQKLLLLPSRPAHSLHSCQNPARDSMKACDITTIIKCHHVTSDNQIMQKFTAVTRTRTLTMVSFKKSAKPASNFVARNPRAPKPMTAPAKYQQDTRQQTCTCILQDHRH